MKKAYREALLQVAKFNIFGNAFHLTQMPKTMAKLEAMGLVEKRKVKVLGHPCETWFVTKDGKEALAQIKEEYGISVYGKNRARSKHRRGRRKV